MLLHPISRKNITDAIKFLNEAGIPVGNRWVEYWIIIDRKEYQFKHLIRKAYELATGEKIDETQFTSSPFTRGFIQNKFGYEIIFKIPENVEFFNEEEISFFIKYFGKKYRADDTEAIEAGRQIKNTIFKKTNTWARALNLEGMGVELDNVWQISGTFKQYSWARIFREDQKDKKVYFTVGVSPEWKALVYKLDCQRSQYDPSRALSPEQVKKFDSLVENTDASWNEIKITDFNKYNWEILVEETNNFIEKYLPLYDEAVEFIWDNSILKPVEQDKIYFQEIPTDGFSEIPFQKIIKGNNSPDYDGENKHKKKIGNAGEKLVIEWEKEFLKMNGRNDLAEKILKLADWDGFDILSYNCDGSERYIEVKTTVAGKLRPFMYSKNEKRIMQENPDKYFLFRLYNYDIEKNSADCFVLSGNICEQILEEPIHYKGYLKK